MSLDADVIVDRRRIRRKLTFWRAAAVLALIVAVFAAGLAVRRNGLSFSGPITSRIARITISGIIRGDQDRVEALEKLGKSSAVRAVVVHIDSPGGTTAGAEQLHQALRKLAGQKPMVIVVDGLAASGGYIAAMAGDHIVAQGNSLVGSIGVLFQYPNFTDLLKTIGVQVEEIKSSPLKAAPNGFEPTSPEARAAIASLVSDSYQWFRTMVQERRDIKDPQLLTTVTDGRVFTGRQGLELKLVDELGNEQTAVDWLVKDKGIAKNLPVRDWALKSEIGSFEFLHLGAAVLRMAGLDGLARRLEESSAVQAFERLNLDGLLVLWHPQPTN